MNDKREPQAMFYAITLDFTKEPGMIKTEDDIKDVDVYRFVEDRQLIDDWPDAIVFHCEGNRIDDYWKPRLLWNLVSDQVKYVFQQYQIQGVQLLPVKVVHKQTGKSYQYWALVVFQEVVALRRKYVQDLDIFRIRNVPDIYISSRLRQYLEQAGATNGFGFRPISARTLDKES